jgi:hypothetical protein
MDLVLLLIILGTIAIVLFGGWLVIGWLVLLALWKGYRAYVEEEERIR